MKKSNKKHASEQNEQSTREYNMSIKKLPVNLIVVLSLMIVFLALVLACLIVNADVFNNFIEFMTKVMDLMSSV